MYIFFKLFTFNFSFKKNKYIYLVSVNVTTVRFDLERKVFRRHIWTYLERRELTKQHVLYAEVIVKKIVLVKMSPERTGFNCVIIN